MFWSAISFNQDLSNWDVARVTNMEATFQKAKSFNQDISKWDVSSVIDMNGMFSDADSFNQDISQWDVSRVTSMRHMFYRATAFKQVLCGEAWVALKATTQTMFDGSSGSISTTVCGLCYTDVVAQSIFHQNPQYHYSATI